MDFTFFKKIPKGTGQQHSIPTVTPSPDIFDAYTEIFWRELRTVLGLTPQQIEEIFILISKGEGGYLNQGRYHKIVFQQYFKDQDWSWPEYDKWKAICIELGKWPTKWPQWARTHCIEESKKRDVTNERLELYSALMRTIHGRATSFYERKRREKLGIKNAKLMIVFEEDRHLIETALAKNPNALSPLFPYDLSMLRSEIPGF
jgi:hypothetical protein